MPRRTRAILLDLDDTLYPLRQFTQSGFAAVAAHLQATQGLDPARTRDLLDRALDGADRGGELQSLLAACDLPVSLTNDLVGIIRSHEPVLTLPAESSRLLAALRPVWKLAIVTNGPAAVQRRKVHALGLSDRVDAVVYASEHGSGVGKPESAPFLEASRRLGVAPSRSVFVGDDECCDIEGAHRAGMRAIRITAWSGSTTHSAADAVIRSIAQLPRVATAVLDNGKVFHAA